MMKIMESLYGKHIWKHMVIAVSSDWSYKEKDIQQRDEFGQFEHQYLQRWNDILKNRSLIEEDIIGVFTDAWSQQSWNLDDHKQQEAWKRETGKLWDFSQQSDLFNFKTVKDFVLENEVLKRKKRQINEQNLSLKEVIASLVTYTNNVAHLMEGINDMKIELVSSNNLNVL